MSEFICNIWKVEHGSAAFLRTPTTASSSSKTALLDAGCSDDFSIAEHLSTGWGLNKINNRLDWLLISHPDRDHIQDLANVYSMLYPRIFSRNRLFPNEIVYPNGTSNLIEPLKTYKVMEDAYIMQVPENLTNPPEANWGGVSIVSYNCKPEYLKGCPDSKLKNNLSMVTLVQYDKVEIFFPGDLEPLGWDALLDNTDLLSLVGKKDIRVLVASHHGRKSGIRNDDGSVYDRFLKVYRPHIVIMSDKWGSENTDRDAYVPYCLGYQVFSRSDNKYEEMKVITTKTNNYVSIQYASGVPYIVRA